MLYSYSLLFCSIMIFTIQNTTSRNHFKGKVFKDPYKIKRLVHFQNSLCKETDDFLRNYEAQLLREIQTKVCLNDVDDWRMDYLDKKKQEKEEYQVVFNPILLYKLIKQMNWFYQNIYHQKLHSFASNKGEENYILSKIQPLIQNNLVFPTDDDVSGITLSLIVIALTYRLHPIELVDGKLGKFRIAPNQISFEDIEHIYTECLRTKGSFFDSGQIGNPNPSNDTKEMIHYAAAIEWMEAAEELVQRKLSEGEKYEKDLQHGHQITLWKKKLENVQLELQKLRRMHDDNFNMITDPIYTQQLPSPEEFFVRKFGNDINIKSKQLRIEEAELETKVFSLQEPESKRWIQNFTRIRDYLTLCRGGTLKFQNNNNSKNTQAKEKCFLSHQDDPFFLLMPLKLEVITMENMSLYMFHSVLTTKRIDEIQEYIDLMDTPFYNETDSTVYWTGTWNYEQIWLEDHYALPIYKTSRLLDKITKLQVTSPELNGRESKIPISPDLAFKLSLASDYLMAGTYSPAGFYYPHYDEGDGILDDKPHKRIATAIIYLSDVEGGGTVFPNIARTVYPSKGSVLFWHNLHSDGIRNEYTLHGGCPVLHGIKTIANKWIHYNAQTFKRPCIDNDRKQIS